MPERFNFTHARLEKLQCPVDPNHPEKHQRAFFYDAAEPGLCLMVTSTGSKSFYLYRKVAGRPERIPLGKLVETTVDRARELARSKKGDIADGVNPADQRRAARGEMTIDELFKRYIDEYAKVHKRTWEDDQAQYDRYVASWKNRKLSSIRRADVQLLHTTTGKDNGPYSANRLLAMLSTLFNFARSIGFTGANPTEGVKRFKEESRERFLSSDEMPRFMKALDGHPDQDMADFFRICLFTGARRSNVQSLAWSNVSFSSRTWTVPGDQSKNSKPLNIYLSDQAMTVLKRRWDSRVQDAKFVFPSHGSTGHITEPKGAWKQVLAAAKITDLRIHDLRRSLGSWMAAAGASLPIIGKTLGHQSQATTAIYARLALDPIKASVESATAAMMQPAPENLQDKKVGA